MQHKMHAPARNRPRVPGRLDDSPVSNGETANSCGIENLTVVCEFHAHRQLLARRRVGQFVRDVRKQRLPGPDPPGVIHRLLEVEVRRMRPAAERVKDEHVEAGQ